MCYEFPRFLTHDFKGEMVIGVRDPGWFDEKTRQQQLEDHIAKARETHFGLRRVAADEKAHWVRRHFNRVAPKYDFMNTLLSLGIHYVWKRQAVRMLGLKPGQRVLDVCGGTGDLSILAARRVLPQGQVVLYDINRAMMITGRATGSHRETRRSIGYVQGDAEALAFPDASFDAAMVGFGIRNLTRMEAGFREMYRVLRPGGRMLCLEFSKPVWPWFRLLYDFYSFRIMPALGQLLAGSSESYACLPETIRMFPLPEELCHILSRIGFSDITCKLMTNGIAAAHLAQK
jgi:demethylmenaquinone methyltransferase/2-methoxy-6-polyprenyl-1,4-benzoquinol methylase